MKPLPFVSYRSRSARIASGISSLLSTPSPLRSYRRKELSPQLDDEPGPPELKRPRPSEEDGSAKGMAGAAPGGLTPPDGPITVGAPPGAAIMVGGPPERPPPKRSLICWEYSRNCL